MADLLLGVNLPWIAYGQDFGASAWRPRGGVANPDMRERMRSALGALADTGAQLVRWWLLGDGRAGLQLERGGGQAVRLDDYFLRDLDAAVAALHEAGLRAVFVLTDFLWFRSARIIGGVQTGGHARLVGDRTLRAGLLESVFAPIARHHARDEAVAAWDLLNEPDWATLGVGTLDPRGTVSPGTMRAFVSDLVQAFRAEGATQPLTVGVARASALPLVRGLGLDLYQMHWYESSDSAQTLAESVGTRALDRPLLLGEFPTRGSSLSPRRILSLAAAAGYCGALAWSLLAEDGATDRAACEAALLAWRNQAAPATLRV